MTTIVARDYVERRWFLGHYVIALFHAPRRYWPKVQRFPANGFRAYLGGPFVLRVAPVRKAA